MWDAGLLESVNSSHLSEVVPARLRVVSNFGDDDCGAGEIHTRARESSRRRDAKGARPTIAIAKIRDYSQSTFPRALSTNVFKCYCQRKPGRGRRSRSAVDLLLSTM